MYMNARKLYIKQKQRQCRMKKIQCQAVIERRNNNNYSYSNMRNRCKTSIIIKYILLITGFVLLLTGVCLEEASCYHTGTCMNNITCTLNKSIFVCYYNCTIQENNKTITNIVNSQKDLSNIDPEKKMYYCKDKTDILTCFLTQDLNERCPFKKLSIMLDVMGCLLIASMFIQALCDNENSKNLIFEEV